EYDKGNFDYGKNYLGIARDDDLVIIQITVNNTRGPEQKKALFACIAELLAKNPGIRPENILVSLLEVLKENLVFRQRHRAIWVNVVSRRAGVTSRGTG